MYKTIAPLTTIALLYCTSCASGFLRNSNLPIWSLQSLYNNDCGEQGWKCPGEDKCLDITQMCDGKKDCNAGNDETTKLCSKEFCDNVLNRWKCPGETKVSDTNAIIDC